MPDWSYQTLFRPLLFRLPARIARRITLTAFGTVGRLPGGAFIIKTLGHQEPSPLLETRWSATPVGLSGRVDPYGDARQGLARLGFGFVEIGPVTIQPIKCREPIELDVERGLVRFPEPYENEGLDTVLRNLANPGHDLPQYVRIAPMPGASEEEAGTQFLQLIESLQAAGAAGFYMDTMSCDWDASARIKVLNRISAEANKESLLLLHLSPDEPADRLLFLCYCYSIVSRK